MKPGSHYARDPSPLVPTYETVCANDILPELSTRFMQTRAHVITITHIQICIYRHICIYIDLHAPMLRLPSKCES